MLRSTWRVEGDTIVRRQIQTDEDKILNFNAEMRKNPGAIRHLSFMGAELNIPTIWMRRLWKKYPDLNHKNAHIKTAAWRKFFASSEADQFRLRDRSKARGGRISYTSTTAR